MTTYSLWSSSTLRWQRPAICIVTAVAIYLVLFATSAVAAVLYVAPPSSSLYSSSSHRGGKPGNSNNNNKNVQQQPSYGQGSSPATAADLPSWAFASDFGIALGSLSKKSSVSSSQKPSTATAAATMAWEEKQQQPWNLGDEECSLRRPCTSIRAAVARAAPHSIIALLPGQHTCEDVRVTIPLHFQGRAPAYVVSSSSSSTTHNHDHHHHHPSRTPHVVIDCAHQRRAFFFDNVPAHMENITVVNGRGEGAGGVLVVRRTEHYLEQSRFIRCVFERCTGLHSPRYRRIAGAVGIFYQRPLGGRTVEFLRTRFLRNTARAATHAAGAMMLSHIDVPRLNYDSTPCTAYIFDGPMRGLGHSSLWGVFFKQEDSIPELVEAAITAGAVMNQQKTHTAVKVPIPGAAAATVAAAAPASTVQVSNSNKNRDNLETAGGVIFSDKNLVQEDEQGASGGHSVSAAEDAVVESNDDDSNSDILHRRKSNNRNAQDDTFDASEVDGDASGTARRLQRSRTITSKNPGVSDIMRDAVPITWNTRGASKSLIYATRVPGNLLPYYRDVVPESGTHSTGTNVASQRGGAASRSGQPLVMWMIWCEDRGSWAIFNDELISPAGQPMDGPAVAALNICKCTTNPCSAPARLPHQRLPHHFTSWANAEPGLDSLVAPRCHDPVLNSQCNVVILNGVQAAQDQRLRAFTRHPHGVMRFGRPLFVSTEDNKDSTKQYLWYCGPQSEWIVSHKNDTKPVSGDVDRNKQTSSVGLACERGISSSRTNALHPLEVPHGAWQYWSSSEWKQPVTPARQLSITCVPPPRLPHLVMSERRKRSGGGNGGSTGPYMTSTEREPVQPWIGQHPLAMVQESGDAMSTPSSTFHATRNFNAELRQVNRMRVREVNVTRQAFTSTGTLAEFVDTLQLFMDKTIVDAAATSTAEQQQQQQQQQFVPFQTAPSSQHLQHKLLRSTTEHPLHCGAIQLYHSLGDALLTGPFVLLPSFRWASRPVYMHISGAQQFVWYCVTLAEWIVVDTDPRLLDPTSGDTERCFRAVSSATTVALSPVHSVRWALFQGGDWSPASDGTAFRCVDGCSSFVFWLTQLNGSAAKAAYGYDEDEIKLPGAAMPPLGGIEGTYRALYSPEVDDGDAPPTYILTSAAPPQPSQQQPADAPASSPSSSENPRGKATTAAASSAREYSETILYFEVARTAWVFARRRKGGKGKGRLEKLYYGTRDIGGSVAALSPTTGSMLSRHPFYITHLLPAPAAHASERAQPSLPAHSSHFQCLSSMTPCKRIAVNFDMSSMASPTSSIAIATNHIAAFLAGNYTESFQLAGRPVYVMTSRRNISGGENNMDSTPTPTTTATNNNNNKGNNINSGFSSSATPEMVRDSNAAIYYCRSRTRWMIGPYSQLQQQQHQQQAASSGKKSSNNKLDDVVCHGWLASQRTLSASPTTDVVWTLMQVKNFNPDKNANNNKAEASSSSSSAVPAAGDRGGGWERVSGAIATTRCMDPIKESTTTTTTPASWSLTGATTTTTTNIFDTMGRPRAKEVSDLFQHCTFVGNEAGTGPYSGGVAASQAGTASAGAVTIVHGRSWLGDDRYLAMRGCNVSHNEASVSESDLVGGGAQRGNNNNNNNNNNKDSAAERLMLDSRAGMFRSAAPPPGLLLQREREAMMRNAKNRNSDRDPEQPQAQQQQPPQQHAVGAFGSGSAGFVANSPTLPLDILQRQQHRFLEIEISNLDAPPSSSRASFAASSPYNPHHPFGSGDVNSTISLLALPSDFPTSPRQDAYEEHRGRMGGDPRAAVSVGGILVLGSAMKRTQSFIFESSFTYNMGDSGALHFASCSGSLVRSSLLASNVALKSGGAVHVADTNVSLQHVACRNNFALHRGGCGFGDATSRVWVSLRSEVVHNNAGREGSSFASLCQVSISDSRLHQLVGFAFTGLFLALSGSDINCLVGTPANYLGGYGCVDDAGMLTHPDFSPFAAMELMPQPGASPTTNSVVLAALGATARKYHQRAYFGGGYGNSVPTVNSEGKLVSSAAGAPPPVALEPTSAAIASAAPGSGPAEPDVQCAKPSETWWGWIWEPVRADSLWIQASRAASVLAQVTLVIAVGTFAYHHLWQGAATMRIAGLASSAKRQPGAAAATKRGDGSDGDDEEEEEEEEEEETESHA